MRRSELINEWDAQDRKHHPEVLRGSLLGRPVSAALVRDTVFVDLSVVTRGASFPREEVGPSQAGGRQM